MELLNIATSDFAGIIIEAFLTEDQRTWITLTSISTGLNHHRQSLANWLSRRNIDVEDILEVKVGKFNKSTRAYPTSLGIEYLRHLVLEKQDPQALNLLLAVTQADLERSIKETNGIQVTNQQHEDNLY